MNKTKAKTLTASLCTKGLMVLTGLILLSACGTTPPTKFYMLSATTQDVKSLSSRKLIIGVDMVSVAGYVERPQIVTLDSGPEITMSEYNRWPEPLSYTMQRVLSQNISAYFKNGLAKPLTAARTNYNYIVQVEINRFDGKFNDKAELDAWWTILDSNNQVLAREYTAISAPLGDQYQELVIQQNNLLSQLSQKIAQRINKLR